MSKLPVLTMRVTNFEDKVVGSVVFQACHLPFKPSLLGYYGLLPTEDKMPQYEALLEYINAIGTFP